MERKKQDVFTEEDLTEREQAIKQHYASVDQPGLDPDNRPGNTPKGQRDPHKTTRDLEDITGNPGHRGVNPNAPTEGVGFVAGAGSINEPRRAEPAHAE